MPFEDPQSEMAGAAASVAVESSEDQSAGSANAGQFAVYDGTAGPIAKIATINAILGILTLGIYRFWGKTRMRQYLWSRVTILGDRLEYTGTPKELLLGFLVAAVVMMGLFGVFYGLTIFAGVDPALLGIVNTIYFVAIYFLVYFAVYRARRYRLTRTQWRGIRFGQTGTARGYALRAMALLLLTGLTLGLCYPYMQTRLQEYRTNNTWFGSRNLVFDGQAYDLFWKWVLALVLAIPTLGISLLWYSVTEFRYFASRTRFGSLRFSSNLTTLKVFLIYLLFVVIFFVFYAVLTSAIVGLLYATADLRGLSQPGTGNPLVDLPPLTALAIIGMTFAMVSVLNVLQFILFLHPMAKAVSETLLAEGSIDLDAIKQSDQERGGRGEGFADVMDVGAI